MADIAQDVSKTSETVLRQAASDFLASYSEFLNAASLLERRPQFSAIHPDTDRSLASTKWLLACAIRELDHVLNNSAARASTAPAEPRDARHLPPIVKRAIEDKILARSPEAERLVAQLPIGPSPIDIIPVLHRDLSTCLEAVCRVDLHSAALLWQLHAALSAFGDAMVKGQFIAIARLEGR